MITESTNLSGNDQLLPEKMSKKTDNYFDSIEKNTVQTSLKHLKQGDLFKLLRSETLYYVEHQHEESVEVYKRSDVGKRIPFQFPHGSPCLKFIHGSIGKDNPLPDQKFGRPKPIWSLKVGQKFAMKKGSPLYVLEEKADHGAVYGFANGGGLPMTMGKSVRVLPLLEKGGQNV